MDKRKSVVWTAIGCFLIIGVSCLMITKSLSWFAEKYYVDKKIGIKLVPPEGWQVSVFDQQKYDIYGLVFLEPSKKGKVHLVFERPSPQGNIIPDERFSKIVQGFERSKTETLVNSKRISIGGGKGLELITIDNVGFKAKTILIYRNQKQYYILFQASEEEYNKSVSEVDIALTTLKFLD